MTSEQTIQYVILDFNFYVILMVWTMIAYFGGYFICKRWGKCQNCINESKTKKDK